MAAIGQVVTVANTPTLIFSVVDGVTYTANGYSRGSNPNIFIAGDANAPLPILLGFASYNTIFLGGSTVAASGGSVGYSAAGQTGLSYNCIGGDSLYGIVASATQAVQLLVLRQ